ncbi:unnamed protein product [Nippostrongylus brasiliensis]|uniref:Uncharacterized protein n=1 Tax=Nippostrongylus brasiliensis TaxID=27835 RepID=A0A0N4Y4P8_NIPBR|nr:unnamed protein product [Nippostrongylus brasiliensis]
MPPVSNCTSWISSATNLPEICLLHFDESPLKGIAIIVVVTDQFGEDKYDSFKLIYFLNGEFISGERLSDRLKEAN